MKRKMVIIIVMITILMIFAATATGWAEFIKPLGERVESNAGDGTANKPYTNKDVTRLKAKHEQEKITVINKITKVYPTVRMTKKEFDKRIVESLNNTKITKKNRAQFKYYQQASYGKIEKNKKGVEVFVTSKKAKKTGMKIFNEEFGILHYEIKSLRKTVNAKTGSIWTELKKFPNGIEKFVQGVEKMEKDINSLKFQQTGIWLFIVCLIVAVTILFIKIKKQDKSKIATPGIGNTNTGTAPTPLSPNATT